MADTRPTTPSIRGAWASLPVSVHPLPDRVHRFHVSESRLPVSVNRLPVSVNRLPVSVHPGRWIFTHHHGRRAGPSSSGDVRGPRVPRVRGAAWAGMRVSVEENHPYIHSVASYHRVDAPSPFGEGAVRP